MNPAVWLYIASTIFRESILRPKKYTIILKMIIVGISRYMMRIWRNWNHIFGFIMTVSCSQILVQYSLHWSEWATWSLGSLLLAMAHCYDIMLKSSCIGMRPGANEHKKSSWHLWLFSMSLTMAIVTVFHRWELLNDHDIIWLGSDVMIGIDVVNSFEILEHICCICILLSISLLFAGSGQRLNKDKYWCRDDRPEFYRFAGTNGGCRQEWGSGNHGPSQFWSCKHGSKHTVCINEGEAGDYLPFDLISSTLQDYFIFLVFIVDSKLSNSKFSLQVCRTDN